MSNQKTLRSFDIKFWDRDGNRGHWEVDAETPELAKQRWDEVFKDRGCDYDDIVEFNSRLPSVND